MPFKFTFLGLEYSKSAKTTCESDRKTSSKSNNQREKFGKAVKVCHKKTQTKEAFGNCMKKELTK